MNKNFNSPNIISVLVEVHALLDLNRSFINVQLFNIQRNGIALMHISVNI